MSDHLGTTQRPAPISRLGTPSKIPHSLMTCTGSWRKVPGRAGIHVLYVPESRVEAAWHKVVVSKSPNIRG